MAKTLSLTLTFSLLIALFHVSSAVLAGSQQEEFSWQNLQQQQQQQQHRLRARTDCRVERLTAMEPTIRQDSEAGRTEFWERNNKEFECAGVAAVRNTIERRGLLLPHYNNAPQLLYVVRGRGLLGAVMPGCAETYESESRSGSGSEREYSRRFMDRHQKVRQFRQGDVLALPAGMTLWLYNNGEERLVTVALLDTGNEANQLDQTFRNYFLAGKPYGYSEQSQRQRGQELEKNNIFNGFDDEILAQVFGVDREIVRSMKGQNDQRGQIVRAERFNVVVPSEREEERGQRMATANGLEETMCSIKMRVNLDQPTRADIYNPRGGRLSTLNSQKLPILSMLRLSAERGILYRNAIMAPHWTVNAHSIIYITRGSGRFQVVGHTGRAAFDGEVREGQLIIVPQNYVVVKKASDEQGLEWISFKTNDNAKASPLAGRLSALRAFPEEVVMNMYGIAREDARRLKYNREESRLFSSSTRSTRGRGPMSRPLELAMDVIKSIM